MAKKWIEKDGVKRMVNVDLFGNPINSTKEDNRPTLLLNDISDSKAFKDCCSTLETHHTKDYFVGAVNYMNKIFSTFKVRSKADPDKNIKLWDKCSSKPYLKKDYISLVALILGDDENFITFFNLLPFNVQRLWHCIYINVYAGGDELKDATGKKWITTTRGSYFYSRTSHSLDDPACCFFSISSYYNYWFKDQSPRVYMPDSLWHLYGRTIFKQNVQTLLNDEDATTPPDSLLRYRNDENIGEQITILQQLKLQGALPLAVNKMSVATVRKAAKLIHLPEFYPDSKDKSLQLMAASILIPMLTSSLPQGKGQLAGVGGGLAGEGPSYWEVIKGVTLKPNLRFVILEFLSHLKSLNKDSILYNSNISNVYSHTLAILHQIKPQRWYSYDEMEAMRRLRDDITPKHITVVSDTIIYNSKATYASNDQRVRVEEAYKCFGRPMAKGILWLMAACGLLEIAYKPQTGTIKYEALQYVHLTPLGEYVFSHTKRYEAKGIHLPTEYFDVDDQHLIIRSIHIDGNNPYETMLNNIAEPIGANRYKVTTATWAKDCKSIDDIEAKENFFISNICENPPTLWTDFFRKMRMRCHPFVNPSTTYVLIKLSAPDEELLQILSSDKYIREHTLRAEKGHLLIEQEAYNKFIEHLKGYGYII